ncbi:MAG: hypothetical protein ACXW6J_09225 [Candidatus Binatia bacterium]
MDLRLIWVNPVNLTVSRANSVHPGLAFWLLSNSTSEGCSNESRFDRETVDANETSLTSLPPIQPPFHALLKLSGDNCMDAKTDFISRNYAKDA